MGARWESLTQGGNLNSLAGHGLMGYLRILHPLLAAQERFALPGTALPALHTLLHTCSGEHRCWGDAIPSDNGDLGEGVEAKAKLSGLSRVWTSTSPAH